ncbi:hypothetical protein CCACVL1_03751 [Corchorus capsularis]|uniref:Uncharacterized protein n=1 Tax=Corchorus capsularis TaxID=210143 RepID=A0A1R3JXK0_COCAP|nr:hypothetical protein CCACVL1_03751 [Corchorus capsularis]
MEYKEGQSMAEYLCDYQEMLNQLIRGVRRRWQLPKSTATDGIDARRYLFIGGGRYIDLKVWRVTSRKFRLL